MMELRERAVIPNVVAAPEPRPADYPAQFLFAGTAFYWTVSKTPDPVCTPLLELVTIALIRVPC